ncbi:tetratricopeptide repeat protein [Actinocorallia longicatena]|uniref:Tetratricopeptide repeat protein 38 n=1 Tax=Actinocorallia longicatena TaxID=111803 RepID=A0ABP6PX50_9ACTN
MATDRQGLAYTGSDEAVAHFDAAVHGLLYFREELLTESKAALEADPTAPMPQVFAAYLGLMGTEPDDAAAARAAFDAYTASADQDAFLPAERLHLHAARIWLDGDIHGAGAVLAGAGPRDVLALAVGHQIDFLTGDARSLRDRVGGVLTSWSADDEHFGPVLGMYGFGLEEAGHYDRSEEVALRSVELNPSDVWAVHAVAHTHEMRGRFAEGRRFYDARVGDWGTGNFLAVHNWWHYAVFALESGDTARALEIYDASIAVGSTAMELLDGSALLWRLLLLGDTGQQARWTALADAWEPKVAVPHYAFNDVHAIMAYLGAGRISAASDLIEARSRWLAEPHPGVGNHAMTADIGLPVARALLAYASGEYASVIALLAPIRHRINEFGGSHAQRDAVQKTLLEAALRGGDHDLARTLISERIGVRPCSPFNWLQQARLADALGQAATATRARSEAAVLSHRSPSVP